MPKGERHLRQGKKNWALLAALIAFIVAIYGITILKFST